MRRDGLKFEDVYVFRACSWYLGVGCVFPDMSDKNRFSAAAADAA